MTTAGGRVLESRGWRGTDLSRRQVERHLRRLREQGLIQPVGGGGNGCATEYLIDLTKGTRKPDFDPNGYERRRQSADIQVSADSHDTQMSDEESSADISRTNQPTSRSRSADISPHSSDIQMSSQPPEEPSLEPPLTTGKSARSASPVVGVGGGEFARWNESRPLSNNASRHTTADVKAYLEDCQRHGQQNIRSVDALAATLLKTGEADEQIQAFLDQQTRESLNTKDCPDCQGRNFTYPEGMNTSLVKKCSHERLLSQQRAS